VLEGWGREQRRRPPRAQTRTALRRDEREPPRPQAREDNRPRGESAESRSFGRRRREAVGLDPACERAGQPTPTPGVTRKRHFVRQAVPRPTGFAGGELYPRWLSGHRSSSSPSASSRATPWAEHWPVSGERRRNQPPSSLLLVPLSCRARVDTFQIWLRGLYRFRRVPVQWKMRLPGFQAPVGRIPSGTVKPAGRGQLVPAPWGQAVPTPRIMAPTRVETLRCFLPTNLMFGVHSFGCRTGRKTP
jgi:hypothetical protein